MEEHDDGGSDGPRGQQHVADLRDGDFQNSTSLVRSDDNGDPYSEKGHHEPSSTDADEVLDSGGVSGAIPSIRKGGSLEELEGAKFEAKSEEISSEAADFEKPQTVSRISAREKNCCSAASPTLPVALAESVAGSVKSPLLEVPVEEGEAEMIGSVEILQELYQRKCKECEGLRKAISFLNEAVKEAEDLVYEKSCEMEQMELRIQGVTYLHEEKRDEECVHLDNKSKSRKKKNKKKDIPSRRPVITRPNGPPTPEGERRRNDPRIKRKMKSKEGEKPISKDKEHKILNVRSEQRKRSKSFENRKHDKENEVRTIKKFTKSTSEESSTHTSKKSQNDDPNPCIEKSGRAKRKEALLVAVSARIGIAPNLPSDGGIDEPAQTTTQNEQLMLDGDVGISSEEKATIEIPDRDSNEIIVLYHSDEELLLFLDETEDLDTSLELVDSPFFNVEVDEEREALRSSGANQTTVQSPIEAASAVEPESRSSSASISPKVLEVPPHALVSTTQDPVDLPLQTPQVEAPVVVRVEI